MGRSRRKQDAVDTSAGTAERAADDVCWSASQTPAVQRPGVLPVPPEGTHETPQPNG